MQFRPSTRSSAPSSPNLRHGSGPQISSHTGAPNFTVDAIARLRNEEPDVKLFSLIGADAFAEIRTWYRWEDVIASVEFIVVTRPGHEYETPPGARVRRLDTVALPVSSSEIRQELSKGETTPDLPPKVAEYIRTHGLYR